MSIAQKNMSEEKRSNITQANKQRKIVLDISVGVYYTIKELSELHNKNLRYFRKRLCGELKNNTNYRYV